MWPCDLKAETEKLRAEGNRSLLSANDRIVLEGAVELKMDRVCFCKGRACLLALAASL